LVFGLSLFGFSVSFADITNGLVAYYPFEGNANDASTNGWHGSNYTGLVAYSPTNWTQPGLWPAFGKRWQAAWFDGNSSIRFPQIRFLDGTSNATITAWVWFNYASGGDILIAGAALNPPPISTRFSPVYGKAEDVRFTQAPNSHSPVLLGFDGGEPIQGLTYGKWLMITLVLESSPTGCVFRCYLDTDLIKETHNASFTSIRYPNDIVLGREGEQTLLGKNFIGVMDEFRIYDRALGRSEVMELFYGEDPNMKIELSHVRVCWFTPTNKTAQLQYRSTLTTNAWMNLGAAIPGTGNTMCITDAIDGPQKFYRVMYLP